MRKRFGAVLQAAAGVLLFLVTGASDAGAVSADGLAYGIICAALLFSAGCGVSRRKPAGRRPAKVVPLRREQAEYAPYGTSYYV